MIRLTYEQKQKNRELRHQIIDKIMEIQNEKSLNTLWFIAKNALAEELTEHVLLLDDTIGSMDTRTVYRLYETIRKEEETDFASEQIMELCEHEINEYIQHGGTISELAGPCGALEG